MDVFAFGCLLWETLSREIPFDGLDPADISANVIKGEKLKDLAITKIDIRLADLVDTCRAVEQARRPNFTVIVEVLNDVIDSQ